MFGEEFDLPQTPNLERLDAKVLESYTGKYVFGPDFYRPGAEIIVDREDSRLLFRWSETYFYPVLPIGEDRFLDRMFWATIIFQRDDQGEVTGFVWKDPDEFLAKKRPKEKFPKPIDHEEGESRVLSVF